MRDHVQESEPLSVRVEGLGTTALQVRRSVFKVYGATVGVFEAVQGAVVAGTDASWESLV